MTKPTSKIVHPQRNRLIAPAPPSDSRAIASHASVVRPLYSPLLSALCLSVEQLALPSEEIDTELALRTISVLPQDWELVVERAKALVLPGRNSRLTVKSGQLPSELLTDPTLCALLPKLKKVFIFSSTILFEREDYGRAIIYLTIALHFLPESDMIKLMLIFAYLKNECPREAREIICTITQVMACYHNIYHILRAWTYSLFPKFQQCALEYTETVLAMVRSLPPYTSKLDMLFYQLTTDSTSPSIPWGMYAHLYHIATVYLPTFSGRPLLLEQPISPVVFPDISLVLSYAAQPIPYFLLPVPANTFLFLPLTKADTNFSAEHVNTHFNHAIEAFNSGKYQDAVYLFCATLSHSAPVCQVIANTLLAICYLHDNKPLAAYRCFLSLRKGLNPNLHEWFISLSISKLNKIYELQEWLTLILLKEIAFAIDILFPLLSARINNTLIGQYHAEVALRKAYPRIKNYEALSERYNDIPSFPNPITYFEAYLGAAAMYANSSDLSSSVIDVTTQVWEIKNTPMHAYFTYGCLFGMLQAIKADAWLSVESPNYFYHILLVELQSCGSAIPQYMKADFIIAACVFNNATLLHRIIEQTPLYHLQPGHVIHAIVCLQQHNIAEAKLILSSYPFTTGEEQLDKLRYVLYCVLHNNWQTLKELVNASWPIEIGILAVSAMIVNLQYTYAESVLSVLLSQPSLQHTTKHQLEVIRQSLLAVTPFGSSYDTVASTSFEIRQLPCYGLWESIRIHESASAAPSIATSAEISYGFFHSNISSDNMALLTVEGASTVSTLPATQSYKRGY